MIGGLSTPKHNKVAIVEESPKIVERAKPPVGIHEKEEVHHNRGNLRRA